MGLRSPFGYVNYEVSMAELMIDMLDKLCIGCHDPQRDWGDKGCYACPAGVFIFEAKSYLENLDEADKRFEMYAGIGKEGQEWIEKRKKLYGKEDSPEKCRQWRRMATLYKQESNAIRKVKAFVKDIEPHACFNANWIWDKGRKDILLPFREAIKDLKFIQGRALCQLKMQSELREACDAKFREELAPIINQAIIADRASLKEIRKKRHSR